MWADVGKNFINICRKYTYKKSNFSVGCDVTAFYSGAVEIGAVNYFRNRYHLDGEIDYFFFTYGIKNSEHPPYCCYLPSFVYPFK